MGAGLSTEVVYEDFSPPHKVVREEGIDTLIVELPGMPSFSSTQ